MKSQKNTDKSRTKFGLFLFFLAGLFALQIAFAFTIHGDIGPYTSIIPGIKRSVSPVLIGRIDSVISGVNIKAPVRVTPEAAFAPATRCFADKLGIQARIDTEVSTKRNIISVQNIDSERFAEYIIRDGDTLEKISRKLFGNARMVQSLVRINRITNDRALRLGGTIRVPRSGLLETVKIN